MVCNHHKGVGCAKATRGRRPALGRKHRGFPGLPGLAREIREDINRIVADTSASPALIGQLLDEIPARERVATIREVFARLPAEQQWVALEKAFGDAEIATALAQERAARLDELHRTAGRLQVARVARAEHRLDTRQVSEHETLTLGLFREGDVRPALDRGHTSASVARRVVLRRSPEPARFQVVEDVFNPEGGYFVTAAYDRRVWEADRLPAHAPVRAGSITPTPQGPVFEPVLYPGGRVDFEVDVDPVPKLHQGQLHLGYVLLGDEDIFAATPSRGSRGTGKGVGR